MKLFEAFPFAFAYRLCRASARFYFGVPPCLVSSAS